MKIVTRALLENDQGKYLLVKHHKKDIWTTPGGHVEKGEPLHKALKREIQEEFGVDIKFLGEKDNFDLEHIKSYPTPVANYKISYDKGKKWEYIFHCKLKNDDNFSVQEEEIKEYQWFSLESILELENVYPQIPLLIKKLHS